MNDGDLSLEVSRAEVAEQLLTAGLAQELDLPPRNHDPSSTGC